MVEYLEIFGKKYPVRIGYYVMKKVKEETGSSFSDALAKIRETKEMEIHETILFAALKMGAYAENGDMDSLDLEEEDMPMVLDLVFSDYLALFSSETFFPKEMQEKAEAGDLPDAQGNGEEKEKPKKISRKNKKAAQD